jgi:dynamin 1-like protein
MQMDYINTSHPAFVGGNKAVEAAYQHFRGAKISTATKVWIFLNGNGVQ